MFRRPPDAEALAALGLMPEDFADDETVEVWPDAWEAFLLFQRVATQWRAGAVGAIGLDYNVLFRLMDRQGLDGDDWDDMLDDIQTMEHAALVAMRAE